MIVLNTLPKSCTYYDLPLKVFGCTTYAHVPSHYRSKLDPRTIICIFLGYSSSKKGYKYFDRQTQKKKKCCEYGCAFFRKSPYFTQNSLKREKQNVKDNFWDVCVSLPNLTCLYVTSPSMPIADNSQ